MAKDVNRYESVLLDRMVVLAKHWRSIFERADFIEDLEDAMRSVNDAILHLLDCIVDFYSKTATELLPCPFCGGEANLEKSPESGKWHVECGDADCIGFWTASVYFDIEAEAIEAWNRRTPEQAVAATYEIPKVACNDDVKLFVKTGDGAFEFECADDAEVQARFRELYDCGEEDIRLAEYTKTSERAARTLADFQTCSLGYDLECDECHGKGDGDGR